VFVLKSGFFDTLTWGAIALQTLHHPLQTKPFPPSQSKVLRTKERDDIPPQISKHYLLGTGILRFSHCPSSENLMKKARMKSRQIVKESLILFLLSLVP